MKNTILTLASLAVLSGVANAQTTIIEDFESYSLGHPLQGGGGITSAQLGGHTYWGNDTPANQNGAIYDSTSPSNPDGFPINMAATATGQFAYFNTDNLDDPTAPIIDPTIWSKAAVSVTPGYTYEFSFDLAGQNTNSPALIQATLDGVNLGSAGTYSVRGVWDTFGGQFTATSSSVNLSLINLNTVRPGNDFALDNLQLKVVPEPSSTALLGLGALGLIARRKR